IRDKLVTGVQTCALPIYQGVTMSVIVMLRIKAEAKRLQEVIDSDETRWQAINSRAKELGAIHHRFLGSADGTEIIVLDEWESPRSEERRVGKECESRSEL